MMEQAPLITLAKRLLNGLRSCAIYGFSPITYTRLYVLGLLCFLLIIPSSSSTFLVFYWMIIGFSMIVIAFIWEVTCKAKTLWVSNTLATNILFSVVSAIFLNMPYALASIFAKHKITELTGFSASYFPHSQLILTFVFFAYLAPLMISITLFLGSCAAMIGQSIKSAGILPLFQPIRDMVEGLLNIQLPNNHQGNPFKSSATILGASFTAVALLGMVEVMGHYSKSIDKHINRTIIAASDHYSKSECKNHVKGTRVALLKDGWSSIAKRDPRLGWSFKPQKCESKFSKGT